MIRRIRETIRGTRCLLLNRWHKLTSFSLLTRSLADEGIGQRPVTDEGKMRVLNVAEKNDAAKNISFILSRGAFQRREGISQYNKLYEFQYIIPSLGNCKMTVTSVSGHVLNLDFGQSHRKWHMCQPVALFEAPVHANCTENAKSVQANLENQAKYHDALIIWTDCDREGENIGYQVINICRRVKPNLAVYRARFSELTGAAIHRAIAGLVPPDKKVSDAVDVRRELDLRIGAAFTRFQTMRLQDKIGHKGVISYGSCQFPTLGFVVERYKQREEFVAKPFSYIDVHDNRGDISVTFKWERVRVFDDSACLSLYSKVLENPEATVTDVKSRRKSKWRPLPMDTVQMEKLASSRLKISAKDTMKIAEKLYTQGLISYPRTETNIFPQGMDLRPLVEHQTESQEWGQFATRILEEGLTPRVGKKTDAAHPPIHPTKYSDSLAGNEKRIYELIVRHFLASVSKDAVGSETTVNIEISEERFHLNGLIVLEKNYLEVYYPYEKWNAKEIPVYQLNERFTPSEIMMATGTTTPPALLSESDLISLMEKHGIGTDATHAEHIETIQERKYVTQTAERRFTPCPLGIGLVEGYHGIGFETLARPFLRAALEKDLQSICEGTKDPKVVLQEQVQLYKEMFIEAAGKADRLETVVTEHMQRANHDLGTGDGDNSGAQTHNHGSQSLRNAQSREDRPDPRTRAAADENNPSCICGTPSSLKRVVKEGPNQGRYFYCCSKSVGDPAKCDFFLWAPDSAAASAANASGRHNNFNQNENRGSTRSRGRGRGQAQGRGRGQRTATGGTQRKCTLCNNTGHNRRNCPNRSSLDDA